jgi:epoxyqueuosine reductase
METQNLAAEIKKLAREVGYVACGITHAGPFEEYARRLDELMVRFPGTRPLYDYMRYRVDPRASAPWVRSIVAAVRWYGNTDLPDTARGHIGANYLVDRRVADCPDHTMPRRMKQGLVDLGLRVKTGGVPDRLAGARAGVTWFGRNTFAYTPEHGSWINVECWRVDVELPPDTPNDTLLCPDDCRACMEACPTGAIVDPLVMRMDHCIAYLTYHAPHPIDPGLWARMGKWVYGCDACQSVCPLNRGKWKATRRADWLDAIAPLLAPESLAAMDAATYRERIHPLFWYIPESDLERWHANARRALGAAAALRNTPPPLR